LAAETGAALNGTALFAMGAAIAVVGLFVLENILEKRRSGTQGLLLAYLISSGIGLHNLGEGLAVGAALAAGEFALGTFLIVGFALHNTTEGLAIVAPLGAEERRPSLWHFVGLGAVAGVPTIAGALLGGYAFTPGWATFAFGLAAGAIAQVVWKIGRGLPEQGRLSTAYGAAGFLLGLAVMYVTGLFTA
ncbi:MAG TPA: ZIP family metal transporter, partial [Actinomycetota bacterium]|nr:ZIP family metal transporter [Actinomycetota bacterium]